MLTTETNQNETGTPVCSPDGAAATLPPADGPARIEAGEPLGRQLLLAGVPLGEVEAVMRRLDARAGRRRPLPALVHRIEAEIDRFHGRTIVDDVRFLALAAVRVWIRGDADVESWHLLCAHGITRSGDQRLVDFRLVPGENVSAWTAFLAMLDRRGLRGGDLDLVTTDARSPVRAALDVVWPGVRRQACWSGLLLHLRLLQREYGSTACINELADVMCACDATAALAELSRWARKWRAEAPAAVDYARRHADELLALFDYPVRLREGIQSVDPLRRLLQGVRARANLMVTFENPSSCERVVYGIAHSTDSGGRVLALELGKEPSTDAATAVAGPVPVAGRCFDGAGYVDDVGDTAHIPCVTPSLVGSR